MPDLNWIMGNLPWILLLLISLTGFVWLTKRAVSTGKRPPRGSLPDKAPPDPAS